MHRTNAGVVPSAMDQIYLHCNLHQRSCCSFYISFVAYIEHHYHVVDLVKVECAVDPVLKCHQVLAARWDESQQTLDSCMG